VGKGVFVKRDNVKSTCIINRNGFTRRKSPCKGNAKKEIFEGVHGMNMKERYVWEDACPRFCPNLNVLTAGPTSQNCEGGENGPVG